MVFELLQELLQLNEDPSRRIFVRKANAIKRAIRCGSGKRKGKAVTNLRSCFKRKNIKLSRKARQIAIKTKLRRKIKTKISLRRPIHARLVRLNSHK